MAIRQEDATPTFFLDRSLGRIQVPRALRDAGLRVLTMADVYGVPADERIDDPTWLRRAGEESWPVLMKDQRIRYRPTERAALIQYQVRAFCLSSGNLTAPAMASQFLNAMRRILAACAGPAPALYVVRSTDVRLIRLDS